MATSAVENVIGERALQVLSKISAERHPDLYVMTPKTFLRGFAVAGINLPRPALMVQMATPWGDLPMTAGLHEADTVIAVHMIVDLPRADEDLISLKRDVLYAMSTDERLGGAVLHCFPESFSAQIEVIEPVQIAFGTLLFRVKYQWSHAAP